MAHFEKVRTGHKC